MVVPAKAADVNPLQPLFDALNNAEMVVENAFDDTAEALIDNINSLALPPSLQSQVDMVCTSGRSTVLVELLLVCIPQTMPILHSLSPSKNCSTAKAILSTWPSHHAS